jgi:hypothetical protein
MKLIIQNYRVVGTATDEYPGPEKCIEAPDWFSIDRMGEYQIALTLVDPNPPVVETPTEPVVETPVVEEPVVEEAVTEVVAETPTEPVVEAPAETPTDGAI